MRLLGMTQNTNILEELADLPISQNKPSTGYSEQGTWALIDSLRAEVSCIGLYILSFRNKALGCSANIASNINVETNQATLNKYNILIAQFENLRRVMLEPYARNYHPCERDYNVLKIVQKQIIKKRESRGI
jgi:hypothetical protein